MELSDIIKDLENYIQEVQDKKEHLQKKYKERTDEFIKRVGTFGSSEAVQEAGIEQPYNMQLQELPPILDKLIKINAAVQQSQGKA